MWLSDQCVSTEWPPAHQMTSMWPLFFHQYKEKNVFTEQVLKLQINNMHVPKVCGSISRYITQLSWKTEPARQSPKKHLWVHEPYCVTTAEATWAAANYNVYVFFSSSTSSSKQIFTFWSSVNICKLFYKGEQGLGPNRPGSPSKTLHLTSNFVMLK